jgi:tight adherence protein B
MRIVLATALAAVVLAALAAAAAAASGSGDIRIVQSAGRFPERAYVLSLPERMRLSPGQVKVTESGNRVSGLTVVPASAAGAGDFGVVLVIDASNSMRGRAIVDAMAAARAFAARRVANQQLAVIAFNGTARVLLPFTTDKERIEAALSTPPQLHEGTHVYDAVARAVAMLGEARIAVGSVIVLSDGADTGSSRRLEAAAASARNSHVRVFSVGIRSASYTPTPLRELAREARGEYSEAASSAELAGIYDRLGTELSKEYLIRYRSLAGPSQPVRVQITVQGLESKATANYTTPELPAVAAEPFHRSLFRRFWESPVAMILVALLTAGLLGLGLATMLRPRPRTLGRRMASFVSVRQPESDGDSRLTTARLLATAEKSLEATKWWANFKSKLELAEIRIPAIHIVLWTIAGTIFAVWLVTTITGSLVFGLAGFAIPVIVNSLINKKVVRKRTLFSEQLPDNLQVLASAIRAGHSFVGALSVVADEAPEPARSEFKSVVADEQLGVPLEDALQVVVERMASRDLEQVALVAALQRQRGANAAEVLERVAETIRARAELRRMVKTLTAQGRMARWIVSALPVVLLGAISALNPEYVAPLFSTGTGRALLFVASILVVSGSYVIKRIVDIKV